MSYSANTLLISALTLFLVSGTALAQEITVRPLDPSLDPTFNQPDPTFVQGVEDSFILGLPGRTVGQGAPDPTFIQGVDDPFIPGVEDPFDQSVADPTFGGGATVLLLSQDLSNQGFAVPFTTTFPIGDCVFVNQGTNAFFDISAGRQMRFDNFECFQAGECFELREVTITALNETRNIIFDLDGQSINVDTRVVLTEEMVNGRPTFTAENFLAECEGTGDVFNFGRNVQTFAEDGSIITDGSWLSGQSGALPGLIFPGGSFLSGARFFQEEAPGVALNRSENLAVGLSVEVPAGTFGGCVQVRETTPLDPTRVSTKFYCPGVGLVADEEVVLIEATGGALGNPSDGLP